MLARYYDQTGNADMSSIIAYYREVVEINKNWEDGWFFLASYYDRLWNSLDERDAHGDVARYIISNLGKSMQYGSHFIYQVRLPDTHLPTQVTRGSINKFSSHPFLLIRQCRVCSPSGWNWAPWKWKSTAQLPAKPRRRPAGKTQLNLKSQT